MKNWWIGKEKAVYSDSRLKSCSHRHRTRPTDKQTWWDLKDTKSYLLVQNCHPFELSTTVTSTWIHLSNLLSNCWWLKHQAQRDGRGGLATCTEPGAAVPRSEEPGAGDTGKMRMRGSRDGDGSSIGQGAGLCKLEAPKVEYHTKGGQFENRCQWRAKGQRITNKDLL